MSERRRKGVGKHAGCSASCGSHLGTSDKLCCGRHRLLLDMVALALNWEGRWLHNGPIYSIELKSLPGEASIKKRA